MSITIGRAVDGSVLRKRILSVDPLEIEAAADAYMWCFSDAKVRDLHALWRLLDGLAQRADRCVFWDAIADDCSGVECRRKAKGEDATLVEPDGGGREWFAIDFDSVEVPAAIEAAGYERCAAWLAGQLSFVGDDTGYVWQATGSAGFKPGVRLRMWLWCDGVVDRASLKAWAEAADPALCVDASLYGRARVIFTADPELAEGIADPLDGVRLGLVEGSPVSAAGFLALAGAGAVERSGSTVVGPTLPRLARLHPIARRAAQDSAERLVRRAMKAIGKAEEGARNTIVNTAAFTSGQVAWLCAGGVERVARLLGDAVDGLSDSEFEAEGHAVISRAVEEGAADPQMPPEVGDLAEGLHVVPAGRVADEALAAELAQAMVELDTSFYLFGGRPTRFQAGALHAHTKVTMSEHLSTHVRLERRAQRGEEVVSRLVAPPGDWAAMLIERTEWSGARAVVGVVDSPTLRPDGSVLCAPGFDQSTGLLYLPVAGSWDGFAPWSGSVESAYGAILDLLSDFCFDGARSKVAALSFLLTVAGRAAIEGPVPLFCFDASMAGTGKGLLLSALSSMAGVALDMTPWLKQEEEREKRIVGALEFGRGGVFAFDEVSGALGSEALRMVTTSDTFSGRILGKTGKVSWSTRAMTWAAVGNNLTPGRDMARRMVLIRQTAETGAPESRVGFRYPALLETVAGRRSSLLAAAMHIVGEHIRSGSTAGCGLPGTSSYYAWSRVVRGALIASGLVDPLEGLAQELRGESLYEAGENALIEYLGQEMGGQEFLAKDLVVRAGTDIELMEHLTVVCYRGEVKSVEVGKTLNRLRGRISGGFKLVRRSGQGGVMRWLLDKV